MYHGFFIHSSVDGHLVCLHVLATVVSATMNMGYMCAFELWISQGIWPGEGNGNPLQYSCLENPKDGGAWWAAVHGVTKSQTRLSNFTFTFHFHALEKEMATHSSVLSWWIPGMAEPGGVPSMGLHRVGHDWRDLAAAAAAGYMASSWIAESALIFLIRYFFEQILYVKQTCVESQLNSSLST